MEVESLSYTPNLPRELHQTVFEGSCCLGRETLYSVIFSASSLLSFLMNFKLIVVFFLHHLKYVVSLFFVSHIFVEKSAIYLSLFLSKYVFSFPVAPFTIFFSLSIFHQLYTCT